MPSNNISNSSFGVNLKTFQLYNSLNVVLIHKPNMPVCYSLSFLAGSIYDLPNKLGTAHFLEHMLMSGSKKYPSKDVLSMQIENLGGSLSASTSYNALNFYVSLGDPDDLEKSFEVLSDLLINSLFDENTIQKERGAILNEIGYTKNSQGKLLASIIYPLLYKDTAYENEIIGTQETVNNITRQDLIDFKNKHINASNASLTIAGDVNEDKLLSLIEKYLTLPISTRKEFDEFILYNSKECTDFIYYDAENVEIELNFKTFNFLHQDRHALSLLSSILGKGRSSRLTKILRYQKGWVYSVGTGLSLGVDKGEFYFSTAIKKEYIQQALNIFIEQIKDIAQKGPTKEELEFVKNRIIKSKKLSMQTCFDWVDYYEYKGLLVPNKITTLDEYLKLIDSVSIDDIKRVALNYFTNDNWFFGLCGKIDKNSVESIKIEI